MARMLLLFPAVHRALSAGHASLIVSRALYKLEMLQVAEAKLYLFLKGDIEDHGKTSCQDLLEDSSFFNFFSSPERRGIEKTVPAKHMYQLGSSSCAKLSRYIQSGGQNLRRRLRPRERHVLSS